MQFITALACALLNLFVTSTRKERHSKHWQPATENNHHNSAAAQICRPRTCLLHETKKRMEDKVTVDDETQTNDPSAASGSSSIRDDDDDVNDNGASASSNNVQQQQQDPQSQSSPAPDDGEEELIHHHPSASNPPAPPDPPPQPPLSKRQQKKLQKRAVVAEQRRQRKLCARETRRAQAIAQGRDLEAEAAQQQAVTSAGTSQWRLQRQLKWETEQLPLAQTSFQICLDCAFDDLMTAKEIASLAKQLRYCYAVNKASAHPCLWAATSLQGGATWRELTQKEPGYAQWSNRAFTGTAQSLQDYYKNNWHNVIYLTSDAERVLERLDDAHIYVIGGMVDRNRLQGAALKRAESLGVATARLPLQEHLEALPSTRVLTCNHVFELLLEWRQQQGNWAAALEKVLPRRKGAKFKEPQQAKQPSNKASNPKAKPPPKQESQSKEKQPSKQQSSAATIPPTPIPQHTADASPTPPPPQEDDWGLAMDFHVFAQHQVHPVYFHATHNKFDILCVEALTPVDMAHLGSGVHDATGHCVWTGAFLVVASLPVLSPDYFAHRRVLELGCGTGIGGLALLLQQPQPTAAAAFVALTDSDPEALALCRRNCHLNQLSNDQYAVFPLTWGQEPLPNEVVEATPSGGQPLFFDTVLATDVLYDIGLLAPLFQTAAACLSAGVNNTISSSSIGYFVLSHVPRACYNSQNPPVDNLEEHIVERARTFGFVLERLVRPHDLLLQSSAAASQPERDFPSDALNRMSLQEMQDIGAAIFVFRRTTTTTST